MRAFDRPVYVADAALRLTTHKPDLGIGDPHDLGKSQHQAAFALPRQQHAIVQRHRRDANVQVDGFTSEGVAASSSWPFQLDPLVSKSAPIASTIPEEEATSRADTAMLRAEAAHPSCAYKRLEHSLRPKLQGDLAA